MAFSMNENFYIDCAKMGRDCKRYVIDIRGEKEKITVRNYHMLCLRLDIFAHWNVKSFSCRLQHTYIKLTEVSGMPYVLMY